MQIVAATHAGMSTEAFQGLVKDWLGNGQSHLEPRSIACLSPLQHLGVACGVSEGGVRPLADEEIDPDCLTGAIIDEEQY